MSDFSSNLKRYRKRAAPSQEQLAEQLDVTRQTVSSWERGNSYPDLDLLVRLADVLKISPNDLLYPPERSGPQTAGFLVETPFLRNLAWFILAVGCILGLRNGVQAYAPAHNTSSWHFIWSDALAFLVPAFLLAMIFLALHQIIVLLRDRLP